MTKAAVKTATILTSILLLAGADLKLNPERLSETDVVEAHLCDGYFIELDETIRVRGNQRDLVTAKAKAPTRRNLKNEGIILNELREIQYTADEKLLAQLVEAEAGTQGYHGKRLVADVVLNRVASKHFPNTIKKVIFQKKQFSVIADGRFDRMVNRVTEESLKAARKELLGPRIDSRILYFNSGPYCMNGKGAWKYKDHWFAY